MNARLLRSRLFRAGCLLALSIFSFGFLLNPSNPPAARTGAPFDSTCSTGCHGSPSGTFNGTISIDGLPAEIQPGGVYSLTITGNVTAGSPVQAGFQLVAVSTSANTQAGTLVAGAGSNTTASGGRTYLRHSSAQAISGGSVSWSFTWTAPASIAGNSMTIYSTIMLGNGGGQSGDKVIFGNVATPFAGTAPVTVNMTSTNITCNGAMNGTATATPSGGNGSFSYAWSNGQTDQTATNLGPGTATVTVTSGASTATGSRTITQPAAINATATAAGTITCVNQSATLTAAASGGAGGFSFAWSDGQSGSPVTVSAPGVYFLTATDGSGCTKTAQATVAGNVTPPTATATVNGPLSCTVASVTLGCATNATNPAFSWSGPGGFSSNLQNPTASEAGQYSVMVTNSANGCTNSATVTVIQNGNPPTVAAAGGAISCTAPTVNLAATTNASNPSFSWTGPGGWTSNLQNPPAPGPGLFTVVVTSGANGCSNSATATVSQNTAPPGATATGGTLTCAAATVILQGSSGTAGVAFSWTGPGGFTSNLQNPTVSAPGDYVLKATNPANGCTSTATATVGQNIAQPTAGATGGNLTCAATSVVLQGSTNAASPAFSWTGPGGFSSNLQNPSVSQPGNYILTVSNPANGCSNSATAAVSQNIAQPTATATGGTLTCAATSIALAGSTNAANASFSWTGPGGFSSLLQNPSVSQPGNYVLTVSNPANGCTNSATAEVLQNTAAPTAAATGGTLTCATTSVALAGSTNAASPAFSWTGPGGFSSSQQNPTVSQPGIFVLTVSNGANGCTASATAEVLQNTTAPTASVAAPAVLNCNVLATQLNATASSQGATFSYQWTASGGGNIQSGGTTLTPTVTAAGNYSLVVSNSANGCTATAAAQVSQLSAVLASVSAQNVACFGGSTGSATASASGGTGSGYGFLWPSGATTATVAGLAAGNYVVTVSDPAGGGCSATATAAISQPALLTANATATGETANGANNGTATAQPTGGTPAFSFLWSNGATTATISSLAPGAYSVTVTDGKGCTAAQSVTVNSFSCAISAAVSSQNVSCFGLANGSATASLTGGAAPTTFLWSNGATTATISGLAPGTFSVSMTDGNGCPAVASATISQPALLAANASATGQTANGQNDGTATAQPTGGTAPFSFFWSNGQVSQTILGLAPGAFLVTVTDGKGCTATQTVVVAAFNCAFSAQVSAADATCFGDQNGVATASASGGTAPFSFLWSNGETTQTIDFLTAGQYSVSMTDAAGCFSVETVTVGQPAAIVLSLPVVQNVACPADQNGSATIAATGGTTPFLFAWSNGQGGPTATGLGAGVFSVTATDANGCKKEQTGLIDAVDNVPPTLVCGIPTLICSGAPFNFSNPTATDNCAGAIQVSQTKGLPSGSIFPPGDTEMAFLAIDAAGNSATCSFVITASPAILLMATVKDATNGQPNGSIDLTVGGFGNGSIFSWSGPGGFSSVVEDPTSLFAGIYTVIVTNPAGCTATATFSVGESVATDEAEPFSSLVLYPNPAGPSIFFTLEKAERAVRGEVIDAAGRRVKRLSKAELLRGEIDLGSLAAGIYFLKIEDEKGRARALGFEKRD